MSKMSPALKKEHTTLFFISLKPFWIRNADLEFGFTDPKISQILSGSTTLHHHVVNKRDYSRVEQQIIITIYLNVLGNNRLHRKKRLSIFPSPAGMSLNKLSLAGNN